MRYWLGRKRLSGPLHPAWKGADATDAAKRARLRRRFRKPFRCYLCRFAVAVRVARDGDLDAGAVVWLCRGCIARRRPKRRPRRG